MQNGCMVDDNDTEKALLAYESDDGTVSILLCGGQWEVRVGPLLVDRFPCEDSLVDLRLGIVRLVRSRMISQRKAGGIFQLSHQRVGQLVRSYERGGVLGLLPKERGPGMQISVRARALLIDLVENRGHPVWHAAQLVESDIGEHVGLSSAFTIVAMARQEKAAVVQAPNTSSERAKVTPTSSALEEELVSFFDEGNGEIKTRASVQESQPSADTSNNTEGTSPLSSAPVQLPAASQLPPQDRVPESPQQVRMDVNIAAAYENSPSVESLEEVPKRQEAAFEPAAQGREEAYLEKLKAGIWISYLGGFLVCGLLKRLGLASIFQQLASSVEAPRDSQRQDNCFWDLPRILMTMVMVYLFRFQSIESVKTAAQESLGLLVGAPNAPSIQTIRAWLVQAAKSQIGERLRFMLAKGYVALGWVRLGVLYIDGHFRPYYGSRKIAHGWFSGRNVGHPGSYEYAVNDESGRPVFLELTPASVSFTKIIPKLVADAKQLRKETGAKGPLMAVVDRGAFSHDLFHELDGAEVVFITWMKNAPTFPKSAFTKRISVPFSRTSRTFWYFETKVKVTGYADDVKALAIYDPKRQHQMVIITNANRIAVSGKRTRIDHARIIRVMVRRWVQENFFKEAKDKVALDQHAGYLFDDEDTEAEVVNPARKKLDKAIAALEKQLTPVNEALAELQVPRPPAVARRKRGALPRGLSLSQLRKKRGVLLERLAALKTRAADTPKHIPHDALDDKDKRLVIRYDKQTILEHIKCAAHNITEMLTQEFRHHCYFDRRDPKPVLHAIFSQPAFCRLEDNTLHIYPKEFPTAKYQRAAELLYDIVNEARGTTLDAYAFPIVIHSNEEGAAERHG